MVRYHASVGDVCRAISKLRVFMECDICHKQCLCCMFVKVLGRLCIYGTSLYHFFVFFLLFILAVELFMLPVVWWIKIFKVNFTTRIALTTKSLSVYDASHEVTSVSCNNRWINIPANISSAVASLNKIFSISPMSVHACKLRVLLRSIAVMWLHNSACIQ